MRDPPLIAVFAAEAGESPPAWHNPGDRASRFGPNIRNKRADGSRGPTTVVPVRLTVDELAGVDASAQPTESRSDTIRRLLLASNPTPKPG